MSVVYDPFETVQWMLDEARSAVQCDIAPGPSGRPRKKPKAQRELERVRYETLCEVLWNVTGRASPLEQVTEAVLSAS